MTSFDLKSNYVFISPHLDDVAISCGGMIKKLVEKKVEITIISVFTKGGSLPYSQEAAWLLKTCGFLNCDNYFLSRKIEDSKVMNRLNVKHIYLDLKEALWREKEHFPKIASYILRTFAPNKMFSLPTIKSLFTPNRSIDRHLEEVKTKLIKTVNKINHQKRGRKVTLCLPLGIGRHVDHLLVKNSLKSWWKQSIFWEDFPYNANDCFRQNFMKTESKKYNLLLNYQPDFKWKEQILRMYKTQFYNLFKENDILLIQENYWRYR